MANVLALDQSTACTGFAIFINQNLKKSGIYKPQGELFQRINKTKEYIRELIQDYNIEYVFIEDIQYQKNQKTYKILSNLQGVIINLLVELNVEFEIIPPSRWKSWNGIKGRKREQQKRNTIEKVKEIYGKEALEDEADAICIGLYGLYLLEQKDAI
jgi:Holliday junction resolvasome RuvABC endonuclease subunit